ncbi:MAG: Nif3-like dinuclear metal center hexameric protein, partial [Bacillota bacterium]
MPVRVKDIIDIIEGWAPKSHAIPEDNPGLLAGDPSALVSRVLVAVDAAPAVIDEAIESGAGMLVTHHPLIFTAIRSIHTGEGQGRLLGRLIGAGISLYAAHTNLDVAEGGVEDLLAAAAGLEAGESGLQVLDRSGEDALLKLVVFVPEGYEDRVRDALGAAGAGWIGKYSDCTFMTGGTGTFRPREGARPFIGEVGKIEKAREFRLETILPESRRSAVLRALLEAHPYEEVAFDLYPLRNEGKSRGFGRVGRLREPVRLGDLAGRLRRTLGAPYVRVCGDPAAVVSTVATAAGSGGGNVAAAAGAGADVLITGDVKHSPALLAMACGLSVIDVGHFSSERAVVAATVERLNNALRERGDCVAAASVS